MRILGILFIMALAAGCGKPTTHVSQTITPETTQGNQTIYQFKVTDISGQEFDMSTLMGQKVMIVNTASKCGLTPQYEELQTLYETYNTQNFTIIGFPANNFMSQEPGDDQKISDFCQKNYGVTFPMMSKISVKGKNQHELYQFLTQKALNGKEDSSVKWNFQKYLINESGELAKVINPKTKPLSPEVVEWIEGR